MGQCSIGELMKTFRTWLSETEPEADEDISEHAIAGYGDWNPNRDRLYTKSIKQLEAEWEFVQELSIASLEFDLYKMNTKEVYILGVKNSEGFDTVFHIELMPRKDIESVFPKYKNIVNVDGVMVKDTLRGNGIAKGMYRYFVQKMHFTILGDEIQYHKARLTWASLSNMDDMLVDIVDIHNEKIIETDVKLHHGVVDHDFDERVWDYADIKKNIRLLLTKVV